VSFLKEHATLIAFLISAAIGVFVFFASKNAFKKRKPGQISLMVTGAAAQRLEEMRITLEKISGRPATLDDVFTNAIHTYHHCIVEDAMGTEFFVIDKNGKRKPLQLFEKAA
jgi:hypothetical protein